MEYKRYIKTENSTLVNTIMSWQLEDTTGWTEYEATDDRHWPIDLHDMDGIYKYKIVDNIIVERSAEDTATQRTKKKKLAELQATDTEISRPIEDIYDALTVTVQNKVDAYTRDKIAAKKTLRSEYNNL